MAKEIVPVPKESRERHDDRLDALLGRLGKYGVTREQLRVATTRLSYFHNFSRVQDDEKDMEDWEKKGDTKLKKAVSFLRKVQAFKEERNVHFKKGEEEAVRTFSENYPTDPPVVFTSEHDELVFQRNLVLSKVALDMGLLGAIRLSVSEMRASAPRIQTKILADSVEAILFAVWLAAEEAKSDPVVKVTEFALEFIAPVYRKVHDFFSGNTALRLALIRAKLGHSGGEPPAEDHRALSRFLEDNPWIIWENDGGPLSWLFPLAEGGDGRQLVPGAKHAQGEETVTNAPDYIYPPLQACPVVEVPLGSSVITLESSALEMHEDLVKRLHAQEPQKPDVRLYRVQGSHGREVWLFVGNRLVVTDSVKRPVGRWLFKTAAEKLELPK